MKVTTELSGIGHYGICTIIDRGILEEILNQLSRSSTISVWDNLEFDPYRPFGIKGSFRIITKGDEPKVKLVWNSKSLVDVLESHNQIMWIAPNITGLDCSGLNLEVFPSRTTSGWALKANFTDEVWDKIESPNFEKSVIPLINRDIRSWWEDQECKPMEGQYTTIFEGVNGKTLQVYQPVGNGLWIAGSREKNCTIEEQFNDHNTDYAQYCFAHILSLCVVLKHCRAM